MALTFNSLPEVVAVPSYRGEFAQVVVSAPDVHIPVLRAADNERVVVAGGRHWKSYYENSLSTGLEVNRRPFASHQK